MVLNDIKAVKEKDKGFWHVVMELMKSNLDSNLFDIYDTKNIC